MILTCKLCKKQFKRSESQLKRSKNHFCSKTCAATYNNSKTPKRKKKIQICIKCGKEISTRRKYCTKCNPQNINWHKVLLKDIIYEAEQVNSNRYARIRDNAKRVYNSSSKPKACINCGYKKHYHIAHIKPIHMFDLDAPINIINSIDNLIALCPNCHWELDNGLLRL